jgi:hypothetical protein
MAFLSRAPEQDADSKPTTDQQIWPNHESSSVLAKLRPPAFIQELFTRQRINSLSPEDIDSNSVGDLVTRGRFGRAETPVSLSAGWQKVPEKPIIRRLLKTGNRLYTSEEYAGKVRSVSQGYLEKSFFPQLTQKEEEFAEIVALRALYNVRLASEACKHSRTNQSSATQSQADPKAKTELQIDEQTIAQLNQVAVVLKSQGSGRAVTLPLSQAYQVVVQRSASARAQISESSLESNEIWRVQSFDFSKLSNEGSQLIQVASLVNVFQDHSIRKGPLRYIPSAWLAQIIAGYVQMDLPIPFGLPLFPRKVQSGVKSRLSIHPDAGEASTLARLNAISHALNLLYPPIRPSNSQDFAERTLTQRRGSFAVGFLDGELFLDCSNVPESTVRDYEQDLQDIASLMGVHRNVVLMPFRDIEKLVPKQFIEKRDKLIAENERKWRKATLVILNRYFPLTPTGLSCEGDLESALTKVIARDPARNPSKKPRGVFEDVFLSRLFSLKYECVDQYCRDNKLDQAQFEVSFFKGIFEKQKEPELEKLRWQVIRESWFAQIKFLAIVDSRKVLDPLSLIDTSLIKLDYARTLAQGNSSPERLEPKYSEQNYLRFMTRRVAQLLDPESVYTGFNSLDLNQWDAKLPDGTPLLDQIWRVMLRCSIHAKQFHIGLNLTTSSERTYQSWQGVPFLRHSHRGKQQQMAPPGRHKDSELVHEFDVVLDGTFAIEAEGGLGGFPLVVELSSEYQSLPSGNPRRYLERIANSRQAFLYLQHDPGTDPDQVKDYLSHSLSKLDRQRSKGGKRNKVVDKPEENTLKSTYYEQSNSLSNAIRDLVSSGKAQYSIEWIGQQCEVISECLLHDLDPSNISDVTKFSYFAGDFDDLDRLQTALHGLSSKNPHLSNLSLLQQANLLGDIREAFQSPKLLTLLKGYRQYVALSVSSQLPEVLSEDSDESREHSISKPKLPQSHKHIINQLRGAASEAKKLGTLLKEGHLEEGVLYLHNTRLVERLAKVSEQIIKLPD